MTLTVLRLLLVKPLQRFFLKKFMVSLNVILMPNF